MALGRQTSVAFVFPKLTDRIAPPRYKKTFFATDSRKVFRTSTKIQFANFLN